ncbi:FAD/NAD(P)-binding domain-containing protein [Alternaria alternata]|uniref:FAD/NAD(P)-binding domain-containing protein n=1 Tax=Alternaria alternata TaxID=5599 RepID=A0A177E1Z2_ALTAL|nr:FAD/NAD(P)-binding domain-containing protein [Alternaria alternata]OAG25974.1 FAD/NAD(P)-binding domain-containing protein [Alternaria alternata]
MEREPPTGVDVLVVGGGIGGLTCAIEAYRKGHNVRILERNQEGQYSGEVIMITTSALETPKKWPSFMERARAIGLPPDFELRKYDGTFIQHHAPGHSKNPSLGIYRKKLHNLLNTYVKELGIPITYECRVGAYFETNQTGGVILDNGERIIADVVVAADGVGSKSREIIDGNKDKPISSGFVVYRSSFPAGPAIEKSPLLAKAFAGYENRGFMYIGPGAHVVFGLNQDELWYLLTTKDEKGTATESWSKTTSTDKSLQVVKDWDPLVAELIRATPNNQCLDWKLMWRDPQPQWVSKGGRVVQLGDAAHPFLPTSFSGGTMAMEDAYSLAACLQISGKKNVAIATKVHNKLRFERVSCAQKMGFKNREVFHNTDWKDEKAAPKKEEQMVGNWLIYHNPEQYAYDKYHECAEHLLTGTEFGNTNLPPGYKYKPWTVRELLEASERGEVVGDEGDWS